MVKISELVARMKLRCIIKWVGSKITKVGVRGYASVGNLVKQRTGVLLLLVCDMLIKSWEMDTEWLYSLCLYSRAKIHCVMQCFSSNHDLYGIANSI